MNYGEQICEAASIIAKGVIGELKVDKTIQAFIVSNKDIDSLGNLKGLTGEYLCRHENIEFSAQGTPCSYLEGDLVTVILPGGDWTTKKNIVGLISRKGEINDTYSVNVINNKGIFQLYDLKGRYLSDLNGGGSFEYEIIEHVGEQEE